VIHSWLGEGTGVKWRRAHHADLHQASRVASQDFAIGRAINPSQLTLQGVIEVGAMFGKGFR
jgi:hypothetical protein